MLESRQRQLTLDVHPHPDLSPDAAVAGTLKIGGEYSVLHDLNAGDELLVIVQNQDGEVLTSSPARVGPVALRPIEDKDLGVIGTERHHSAKLTE